MIKLSTFLSRKQEILWLFDQAKNVFNFLKKGIFAVYLRELDVPENSQVCYD